MLFRSGGFPEHPAAMSGGHHELLPENSSLPENGGDGGKAFGAAYVKEREERLYEGDFV